MRNVVLAGCVVLSPALAGAQTMEVGGTVAAACLGSDGSACGNGTRPLVSAHASWWGTESVELSVRIARSPLPSAGLNVEFPSPVAVSVTRRSREFVSGMFLYHFRRGRAVRPMLGFGSGGFARAQDVRCQPVGCAGVPGLPPEGRRREWMTDVILVAGLSGNAGGRWIWRGGWLSHRFANDENSTIEYFAGVGYRFH